MAVKDSADDIAGLSERLRRVAGRWTRIMANYPAFTDTEMLKTVLEAEDQLDSLLKERDALQARVKELEGELVDTQAALTGVNSDWAQAESRATRLQQERDAAYERLVQAVRDTPSPDADGHYTMTKEDVIAIVRRLDGPEKIAAANDGEERK